MVSRSSGNLHRKSRARERSRNTRRVIYIVKGSFAHSFQNEAQPVRNIRCALHIKTSLRLRICSIFLDGLASFWKSCGQSLFHTERY